MRLGYGGDRVPKQRLVLLASMRPRRMRLGYAAVGSDLKLRITALQ